MTRQLRSQGAPCTVKLNMKLRFNKSDIYKKLAENSSVISVTTPKP